MATKYELSKTYQYRKVMKPLLERKRRARINKCLDELKDIMAECLQQQSGDPSVKFEKADILELTVQHLRKIKSSKRTQQSTPNNQVTHANNASESFRAGYIKAAHEVSRCLASMPNIDVAFGTKLMTHLGARLNQLEAPVNDITALNKPLSINCGNACSTKITAPLYSPVSSGYASDNDYQSTSPAPAGLTEKHNGILQTVSPVWRPW